MVALKIFLHELRIFACDGLTYSKKSWLNACVDAARHKDLEANNLVFRLNFCQLAVNVTFLLVCVPL